MVNAMKDEEKMIAKLIQFETTIEVSFAGHE